MSPDNPFGKMIPARPLHVSVPSPTEAASEARLRDLTAGEPLVVKEVSWFEGATK